MRAGSQTRGRLPDRSRPSPVWARSFCRSTCPASASSSRETRTTSGAMQRRTLPYLDKLTVAIIGDQNTEALRLQAGEIDLMSNGEIRPQDYAAFKRLESAGRLRLYEIGTSLDPDFLWFNLSPKGARSPGRALLAQKAFRQAISYAVDRQAIADTVYLGAAVPIYGPVSPGTRRGFPPTSPIRTYDATRARALLASLGLTDRDGDGMLETARRGAGPFLDALAGGSHPRSYGRGHKIAAPADRHRRGSRHARSGRHRSSASGPATTTASTSASRPAAPIRRSIWTSGSVQVRSISGIRASGYPRRNGRDGSTS